MIVGVDDRGHRRRGARSSPPAAIDTHIHFICPQQADEAIASGVTTFIGGGTGPATGTNATTCTPGARHIALMLAGDRRAAAQHRAHRQGQHVAPEGLVEQIRAGAVGPQAARGLGHDAGGDRLLPRRRRAGGRAGHDPHRHAERVGLRRRLDRRVQGPDDPHVSHRGRGRRPRAGHHPRLRRAERAPELDEPDAAVHGEHARRAPRHAHGVSPPRSRRSPRTSRSPRAGSAARRSPPRTSCTTSARSASSRATARRWAASAR